MLAKDRGQTVEAAHVVGGLLKKTAASRFRLIELAHLLQHLGQRRRDRNARRALIQRLLAQNQPLGQPGLLAHRLQTLDQQVKRHPIGLERDRRVQGSPHLRRLPRPMRCLCDAQIGLAHHGRRAPRTGQQLAILTLALVPLPRPPEDAGQMQARFRITQVEIEQHAVRSLRVLCVL